MRKFNVGDRVRIILRTSPNYGRIATVIKVRRNANLLLRGSNETITVPIAYEVDLPPSRPEAKWTGYTPENIVPHYDGDEPAKWADCVWQPKAISAC